MKREPKIVVRTRKVIKTAKDHLAKGQSLKDYARRQTILNGLLSGTSLEDIGKQIGLSRASVTNLTSAESFKEEFAELLAERRDRLSIGLEDLGELALKVHREIMESPGHKQRLDAAEGVLDRLSATQKRSTVKQQVTTTVVDEFTGRSQEDLQFYVNNGYFPEESPK